MGTKALWVLCIDWLIERGGAPGRQVHYGKKCPSASAAKFSDVTNTLSE